jgi:hypothetical protein
MIAEASIFRNDQAAAFRRPLKYAMPLAHAKLPSQQGCDLLRVSIAAEHGRNPVRLSGFDVR